MVDNKLGLSGTGQYSVSVSVSGLASMSVSLCQFPKARVKGTWLQQRLKIEVLCTATFCYFSKGHLDSEEHDWWHACLQVYFQGWSFDVRRAQTSEKRFLSPRWGSNAQIIWGLVTRSNNWASETKMASHFHVAIAQLHSRPCPGEMANKVADRDAKVGGDFCRPPASVDNIA